MPNTKLGIDLGGTKIEAIILKDDNQITHRLRIDTPKNNYRDSLQAIKQLAEQIELEAEIKEPLPIGIGTPGAVSFKTGLMKNCNSTCLNGHALREDLEQLTARPVRIANDADCFALSETMDGAAMGANNVFGVILGTGVGGGICVNQQLLQGVNAIAGEWGHNPLALAALQEPCPAMVIDRSCFCGQKNCIESWLAGPAFEKSYRLATGNDHSAIEIVELCHAGEPVAIRLMSEYHNMLALALASVINVLDPEKIVLGGGMSNIPSIYTELPKLLNQYVYSDRVDTEILPAKHGDSSGVRGAAWLWNSGKGNT